MVACAVCFFSLPHHPCPVYFDNLGGGINDLVAEAASHEAAHNLGLSHDRRAGEAYYRGHGDRTDPTSWGPIMGAPYGKSVTQWSLGK